MPIRYALCLLEIAPQAVKQALGIRISLPRPIYPASETPRHVPPPDQHPLEGMAHGPPGHVVLIAHVQLLYYGTERRGPHQPVLSHQLNDMALVEWGSGLKPGLGGHVGGAGVQLPRPKPH